MATTRKTDKPKKKEVRDELTFLDVRQAARDGQKVFDKFVITGRAPTNQDQKIAAFGSSYSWESVYSVGDWSTARPPSRARLAPT